MKKILLVVTMLAGMITGCNENKKEDKAAANASTDSVKTSVKAAQKTVDWSKYASATPEQVQAMANHYQELVLKDPSIGFQQINMDGELLSWLMDDTKGLKLVAAADLKTNAITMFMQFWIADSFYYYDIHDFFNSAEKGMRGQAPLCPPPGACDLPMNKGPMPHIITQGDAQAMAQHYNELVMANPAIAIRQITMDGLLLEIILYGADELKLIAAADLKTNETTVIMEFWKGGDFYYYDIRDIFRPGLMGMRGQSPLCPPPGGCDLPFVPAPKMGK